MTLADLVYIEKGLASARPASPPGKRWGWYATDTDTLSIWDGSTWNDVGGGGGGPTGSAGGVLDGTYPNPGLAAGVAGAGLAESSDVLSVNVDGTTIEITADTLNVKSGVFDAAGAAAAAQAASQPLDADLTAIAGLSPTNDDIIQRKAGVWTNRTMAQLAADLPSGTVSSVFGRAGAVVAVTGDYAGIVAAFLTGATSASRYVGATTSGAPVTGTFATGDFVIARDGKIFVCTAGGSPGTWADVSSGAAVGYATPSIALGSAAAAGAATTVIRSDSTIAAFDTTDPSTQAFGDAAAVGTAAFAARRDHKHAMPSLPVGGSVKLYDFTITGAAQTSIDTNVDGTTVANFAGYDVLEIWMLLQTDEATGGVSIIVNNDGGAKYDVMSLRGTNTTVAASNAQAATSWVLTMHGNGGTTGYAGLIAMTIPGYAATVWNKIAESRTMVLDNTAGTNRMNQLALGFRDTAAITRIKVSASVALAKLAIGSRLVVYGR